mgnify:CR=1 FL=1
MASPRLGRPPKNLMLPVVPLPPHPLLLPLSQPSLSPLSLFPSRRSPLAVPRPVYSLSLSFSLSRSLSVSSRVHTPLARRLAAAVATWFRFRSHGPLDSARVLSVSAGRRASTPSSRRRAARRPVRPGSRDGRRARRRGGRRRAGRRGRLREGQARAGGSCLQARTCASVGACR